MPRPADSRPRPPWTTGAALAVLLAAAAVTSWPGASTPPARRGRDALEQTRAPAGDAALRAQAATPDAAPIRAPAAPPARAHAQGLFGRVVDADGYPVEAASVHLIEALGARPGVLALAPAQPHLLAPVASAEVSHDGTFALGLGAADERTYELCVVSSRHAPLRLGDLAVLAAQWHDLGTLTLEDGATVRGRVTFADRPGLPVPYAQVTLTAGGALARAALAALPGGDAMRAVRCDPQGFYELRHAPPRGVVQLTAQAPGLARALAQDVELREDGPTRVDFELAAGARLFGVVRTMSGAPVSGARVQAASGRAHEPAVVAHTDSQGVFCLEGLPLAPHRVRATAPGFAVAEHVDVDPAQPLALTLAPQHRVRVTVRAPSGGVARRYRLALRRFFPDEPATPLDAAARGDIGVVAGLPVQHVRLDNATRASELRCALGGVFVVEVRADGWATSFSAPLRLPALDGAAGALREVEVTLSRGGTLEGSVQDEHGNPVAGATVTSQPAGTVTDSPLLQALQAARPARATRRTVVTDTAGRFSLERLAAARYQLRVEHPDWCRALVDEIDCKLLFSNTLPPIRLEPGALVHGTTGSTGHTSGQIRVILTSESTSRTDRSLRLETVTDPEGRYAFDRRIPPGSYVLRAAAVGSSTPDSEIFHQLLQLDRSSLTLRIAAGERTVERHLDLPAK